MAFTDFLFQGNAPPSVTTYGSQTQNFPQWWSDYTQGLIGRANAQASEGYQTYGGPRVAGATADQQKAYDLTRQNVGSADPYINQAGNLYSTGASTSGASAAAPWLTQAAGTDSLAAAQPYIDQASQTFPGAVQDYMSPYTSSVIDEIERRGKRNLVENLLPGVNDTFTRSGQFGSGSHADITGRAVRDVNESILGETAKALEAGYTTAGDLFNKDMSRMGNLGQLAGQMTSDTARRALDAGAQMGQLTGQDASRMIQAGQGVGALGALSQSTGLTDAAALQAIGQEQQNLSQRSLDVAHQNFEEQRDYPRQTIDWMSSVIRGMNPPTTTTSTGTGPASSMGPSPLATLAGTGMTMYGLSRMGMFRRGGRVGVLGHPGMRGGALARR